MLAQGFSNQVILLNVRQQLSKLLPNYQNPQILAQISEDLGEAMVGINENEIQILMAERGK